MKEYKFNFYDTTTLKSYDLNENMRYQLAILDSLDVFTRLHSENVANLTCRICEYLHMKNYFTVYSTICAYLHDIGKQFIPSNILQKNGPLTDEEYEIMKTHAQIGYDMCMRNEKLRPYAAGPIYHHEALDGSGYPKGLTKDDIPLTGQIIRVADEFDAITSKRQYKSHIGICETLEILISETKPNSQFENNKKGKLGRLNPKIVKALLKVILDDTEYEIFNLSLYINYLKDEIKRLEQVSNYYQKMYTAKNDSDREYYEYGLKSLLQPGETIENFLQILEEYKHAFFNRQEEMDNLTQELKNIKKLKV